MKFTRPLIMGILNITPDSFSDGGLYLAPKSAFQRIEEMICEGADIIDVGGESTKPGSLCISEDEEMKRVKPIIDHISKFYIHQNVLFSIDTHKVSVARYALAHGFKIVNDVTALRGNPSMIETLLAYKSYIVLMYLKNKNAHATKNNKEYHDVIASIKTFLRNRIRFLEKCGFPKKKIIIDPGMGAFVSTNKKYSYEIIERLSELKELGHLILVGISRKMEGSSLDEKDNLSVALTKKAVEHGASLIRTHDVARTIKALHALR